MANTSKGRFPSYGLVRGPSHSEGGVPASVANGPDVELEGGEYIIPKEAVPDYLPVLQQITQVGRDRQQMQNGNTAIDALIASASMQNGISEPKSPMYQEGGEVGFEQIADLAKRYRDNIGLPVEEGMFTPEGGFTKEGYARKFGVEPESFDIDTVFFKSPANYSFRFVDKKGEPIKSTKTKGQSRTTMLPILSDMLKQKAAEKIDVTDFDNIQKRMKQAQMENTFSELVRQATLEYPKAKQKQQGGMIEYEDGGRISNFFKKQKENFQRAAMMGEKTGTRNPFLKTAEEQLAIQARDTSPLSMRRESPNISLGELEEVALVQPYRPEVMSAREQVNMLPDEALEEIQMSQDTFEPFGRIPNMPEDERGNFLNYLFGGRDNLITTRSLLEDILGLRTSKQQGGMVQYEDGGEVHSRRMFNQGTGFNKKKSDLDGDGNISEYERKRGMAIAKSMGKMQMGGMVGMQRPMNPAMNFSPMQRMNPRMYQEGGQVQPRKQFELRNPETFIGPPDSLIGRVYMNPFTGEFEDADAQDKRIEEQIKRLRQRMKQSEIPSSKERVPMQEGGQVQLRRQAEKNTMSRQPKEKMDVIFPFLESIPRYLYPDFMGPRSPKQMLEVEDLFDEILRNAKGDRKYYIPDSDKEETGMKMAQEGGMVSNNNLMGSIASDQRIAPLQPDVYQSKSENGVMIEQRVEVPKLAEAILPIYGLETPLSKNQGSMLKRNNVAPNVLNPQVKGLINRVLVQRLAAEGS